MKENECLLVDKRDFGGGGHFRGEEEEDRQRASLPLGYQPHLTLIIPIRDVKEASFVPCWGGKGMMMMMI